MRRKNDEQDTKFRVGVLYTGRSIKQGQRDSVRVYRCAELQRETRVDGETTKDQTAHELFLGSRTTLAKLTFEASTMSLPTGLSMLTTTP